MKWRWLALAVALPALLWAGWWVVGSRLHATALEVWLGQRRADGWVAEAGSLSTAGFPSRFDTRVERLSLADPEQGWAWETPFIDILMLAWQPNAAILALPPGQTVAVPGVRARLDASPMRASVRFRPGLSMPLVQLSAEADALTLTGEAGWQAGAQRLAAHLRAQTEADAPPNAYRAFAEAVAVRLPPAWRAVVDPAGALSPVADSLRIDARLAFDAPIDRQAVEDRMPGLRAIGIETAELRWGDLALRAAGTLTADAAGFAEGRLDVRAENWRAMLAAMVQGGLISRDAAGALEFGLGLLSRERGGRSVIEVPLSFAGGAMRLGPVPIGAAPRLRAPGRTP